MTQTIDTLLLPRWIVPIEPHNVYHESYALAIHAGRIVDLLPQDKAKEKYSANQVIDLPNHVVLPGFINAHAHSPMTLLRGLADDLALMDWLNHHIWPVEKKYLSEEFVQDGTELAFIEMIRCGTIGFNEHYFFYEKTAEVAVKAGMRARAGVHLLDAADLVGRSNLNYINTKGIEFIEQYKNHPLVQPSFAPHAPYTVGDEGFLRINEISQQYQIPIHLHVQETAFEVESETEKYGKRPMKRLHDLGLLSPLFQAVHMTQVNEADLELLVESGSHVIHCPESNLKLASGFCPAQRLLDANVNVALGTDGAASNNDLDMLGEMRTAALIGKIVAQKDTAVSAADALRMATLNGAKAMHWDKEIGSLEVGKSADMIAMDLSDANTQPVYNPISQIVYAAHQNQVTDVWVQGRPLMRNRELRTLDEKAIFEKTQIWRDKIKNCKG
jgi:5-methylthioadenosine/S-adenosylhomocysteine deaminase